MTCAFLVVTYNSSRDLGPLLESLWASASSMDEILFWDNGSTDDTLSRLNEVRDPRVRVLSDGGNHGFGEAMNRLAAAAAGDLLILVNPDCHWEPTDFPLWLKKATLPGVGALAPLIRYDDGRIQPNRGGDSSLSTFFLQFLKIGALVRTLNVAPFVAAILRPFPIPSSARGFLMNFSGVPQAGRCDWISGAFCAIPRSAFLAIRGFDAGFFMYSEDEDLCRRLRKSGLTIEFDPSLTVIHAVGNSQKGSGYSKAKFERYRSQLHLLRKWQGKGAALALKAFWTLGFPVKAIGTFLSGDVAGAGADLRYLRQLVLQRNERKIR